MLVAISPPFLALSLLLLSDNSLMKLATFFLIAGLTSAYDNRLKFPPTNFIEEHLRSASPETESSVLDVRYVSWIIRTPPVSYRVSSYFPINLMASSNPIQILIFPLRLWFFKILHGQLVGLIGRQQGIKSSWN